MSCAEVESFLERFLSGKLSGAEARHIRGHLASCPRCASNLIAEDRVELLPALDEEIEPSEDFRARFMARLETHRAQAARRPADTSQGFPSSWRALFRNWTLSNRLAAAGALAAIVAFGVYVGTYQSPQPSPDGNLGDIAIAENLPLLRDMKVIESLEFLEDFDAIQNLSDGGKSPSSVQ